MENGLADMSLVQLWELFPIILTPHNPEWEDWARSEISVLHNLLAGYYSVISHIGSTAIPEIQAKPIIDILVEMSNDADRSAIRILMEQSGYICMAASGNRMSFNKGYTPKGYAEKVFHIHFHVIGDHDEIYFRDYLRQNPLIAREYESLKLSLLPKYRNDRDGYTYAKTDFVRRITALAKSTLSE